MQEEQDAKYPFECPTCGDRFATQAELERHRRHEHAAEGEKVYKCAICGAEFPNQARLDLHRQQHHQAPTTH